MFASYLALLTAAGAMTPAAAVRYDDEARTGFVAGAVVQQAFGWDRRELASNAAAVVFHHDFRTDDTYAVTCGRGRAFRVVHHREFGRYELADVVTRGNYGTPGFRITGAVAGISGTSAPLVTGGPCPDRPGARITRLRLTATTTGWTLGATAGDVSENLLTGS